MEKTYINFDSVKVFVNWLIDNEGVEVHDLYGRIWKYEYYSFLFKDIGTHDVLVEGLQCLHLYGTYMYYFTKINNNETSTKES